MTADEQINGLNQQMEAAKADISLFEVLKRLEVNVDFIRLITKEYFENEASRVVLAKGNPNLSQEGQEHLDKVIVGIGQFAQFLNKIAHYGAAGAQTIKDAEKAKEEIYEEESTDVNY